MKAPPLPENESQRLQALCDLNILDTRPEERFDRFTRIARELFRVPMAIISLVDAERQWFKSRQGLDAEETSREISFCGHAILDDRVFHVPNAVEDERFADNPLVTGPLGIRFYAGAPLAAADGSRIGTLCILDTNPRVLTDEQIERLRDLATCVADELNQVKLRETLADLASQRRYTEQILDSVSEGIIAIDEAGVVRSFNPAAERMFGYRAEDRIGAPFTTLLSREDAERLTGAMHQFLTRAEQPSISFRQEVEGRRQDGSTFPVGLTIGTTEFSGERIFNGVVRDITERKELDRMKDEFISTVSHELRTPLTSIMGSIGLIRGGACGELPEEVESMLDIAQGSCDRLIRLVNDMLDLERIESGHAGLESVPVDLNRITDAALDELAGYSSQHDVSLEFSGTDHPAMSSGDPDQLARVVTNLASNAVKHSPAGGTVRVTVRAREDRWRVAVVDEGPGIPVSFQPEVFNRFAQSNPTDGRSHAGTGLGLSIAKAIVDHHGGDIGFTSEAGRGTTFHFDLPRLTEHSAPPGEI